MKTDSVIIKAVAPTLTTETTLTLALASFGIESAQMKHATPLVIYKTTSAGLGKANTDTVTISGTNLIIAEGASGFVTGDIWYIQLLLGEISSLAGTASS